MPPSGVRLYRVSLSDKMTMKCPKHLQSPPCVKLFIALCFCTAALYAAVELPDGVLPPSSFQFSMECSLLSSNFAAPDCFTRYNMTAPYELLSNDQFVFQNCTFFAASSAYFVIVEQAVNVSIILQRVVIASLTMPLLDVSMSRTTTGLYDSVVQVSDSCIWNITTSIIVAKNKPSAQTFAYVSMEDVSFTFYRTNASSGALQNVQVGLIDVRLAQASGVSVEMWNCRLDFDGEGLSGLFFWGSMSHISRFRIVVADSLLRLVGSRASMAIVVIDCWRMHDFVSIVMVRSAIQMQSSQDTNVIRLSATVVWLLNVTVISVLFHSSSVLSGGHSQAALLLLGISDLLDCNVFVEGLDGNVVVQGIPTTTDTAATVISFVGATAKVHVRMLAVSWNVSWIFSRPPATPPAPMRLVPVIKSSVLSFDRNTSTLVDVLLDSSRLVVRVLHVGSSTSTPSLVSANGEVSAVTSLVLFCSSYMLSNSSVCMSNTSVVSTLPISSSEPVASSSSSFSHSLALLTVGDVHSPIEPASATTKFVDSTAFVIVNSSVVFESALAADGNAISATFVVVHGNCSAISLIVQDCTITPSGASFLAFSDTSAVTLGRIVILNCATAASCVAASRGGNSINVHRFTLSRTVVVVGGSLFQTLEAAGSPAALVRLAQSVSTQWILDSNRALVSSGGDEPTVFDDVSATASATVSLRCNAWSSLGWREPLLSTGRLLSAIRPRLRGASVPASACCRHGTSCAIRVIGYVEGAAPDTLVLQWVMQRGFYGSTTQETSASRTRTLPDFSKTAVAADGGLTARQPLLATLSALATASSLLASMTASLGFLQLSASARRLSAADCTFAVNELDSPTMLRLCSRIDSDAELSPTHEEQCLSLGAIVGNVVIVCSWALCAWCASVFCIVRRRTVAAALLCKQWKRVASSASAAAGLPGSLYPLTVLLLQSTTAASVFLQTVGNLAPHLGAALFECALAVGLGVLATRMHAVKRNVVCVPRAKGPSRTHVLAPRSPQALPNAGNHNCCPRPFPFRCVKRLFEANCVWKPIDRTGGRFWQHYAGCFGGLRSFGCTRFVLLDILFIVCCGAVSGCAGSAMSCTAALSVFLALNAAMLVVVLYARPYAALCEQAAYAGNALLTCVVAALGLLGLQDAADALALSQVVFVVLQVLCSVALCAVAPRHLGVVLRRAPLTSVIVGLCSGTLSKRRASALQEGREVQLRQLLRFSSREEVLRELLLLAVGSPRVTGKLLARNTPM